MGWIVGMVSKRMGVCAGGGWNASGVCVRVEWEHRSVGRGGFIVEHDGKKMCFFAIDTSRMEA